MFMMNLNHQDKNNSNNYSYLNNFILIFMILVPLINNNFNKIKEFFQELFYPYTDNNIVSIKFPVHEVRIQKDSYGRDSSIRQLYSIQYLAINDFMKNNLKNINGISNLVEILNVSLDYYSNDTNEKNFVLIPSDSTDILIREKDKIYCKIKSTEKKNRDKDDKDNKKEDNNEKTKSYELILFIKCDTQSDYEKKCKLVILNNFIEECLTNYNTKNNEKDDGKHFIYEYYHCYKDEYSGLELKFKEYLFQSNKDLEKNIFFEGKDKLIQYVNKFIFNKNDIEKNIINKYEQEYKDIGYTYKATFLLYGFPGCGKTSVIKGILNKTGRKGIIINWSKIKTCDELQSIFRIRKIKNREYNSRELCFIIEDCDASKNNILLSRKTNSSNSNKLNESYTDNETTNSDSDSEDINKESKSNNDFKGIEKILKDMNKSSTVNIESLKYSDDCVNLSCLLNILDGIIELDGVMVIFTTNHPEKLDDAFLRPGRIDYKQEFKRASISTIKSIIYNKYKPDNSFNFPQNKFIDYVLSPAEVQSVCFNHDNIDDCINELIEETIKNKNRITPITNFIKN